MLRVRYGHSLPARPAPAAWPADAAPRAACCPRWRFDLVARMRLSCYHMPIGKTIDLQIQISTADDRRWTIDDGTAPLSSIVHRPSSIVIGTAGESCTPMRVAPLARPVIVFQKKKSTPSETMDDSHAVSSSIVYRRQLISVSEDL